VPAATLTVPLEQTTRRDADGQDRRLRVLGQHEPVFGPFENEAAERLAKRLVSLRERVTTDRKRVGQRLAHTDLLRPLSWKDERDH
jgi:hypothetical protein